ncbi:hypothetical protein [Falsiroseomonas oryziterrae]|uniref:hypothetical protein n=1 Tax=Falsiroseomonas oryziterrae TaxID=2911368 RepID=UPI001F2E0750|nr:hypothetical protein [Roseomonas sp. NPKOSM-4]
MSGERSPTVWLRVGPGEVGIACRYKAGPTVRSTDEGGHADAVLPGGVPVGYYARTRRDRRLAIVAPGMVRDARALLRDRPEYMIAAEARARRCPTTFCVVEVGREAALLFTRIWEDIAERPPRFVAVGGNCAQVIARALVDVGAMPRRWPPPGSPDSLFRALHRARPDARVATGFAEFVAEGDGYAIRLDAA